MAAIASESSWLTCAWLVLFGRYCRIRPLVFSLVPRSHAQRRRREQSLEGAVIFQRGDEGDNRGRVVDGACFQVREPIVGGGYYMKPTGTVALKRRRPTHSRTRGS